MEPGPVFLDRLLEVDDIGEAAMRKRDLLCFLSFLDLLFFSAGFELLRARGGVGGTEVGSSVDQGVEEFDERVVFEDT